MKWAQPILKGNGTANNDHYLNVNSSILLASVKWETPDIKTFENRKVAP